VADDGGIDALADKLTRRTRSVPPPRHAPPPRSQAPQPAPAPAASAPPVPAASPSRPEPPAVVSESGPREASPPPPAEAQAHNAPNPPEVPDAPPAASRPARARSQAPLAMAPARERGSLAGGETHLTLRVPKALDDDLVDRIYSLRRERGFRSTKTELVKMFLWGLREESDEELERKVRAYRRAVEDSTSAG